MIFISHMGLIIGGQKRNLCLWEGNSKSIGLYSMHIKVPQRWRLMEVINHSKELGLGWWRHSAEETSRLATECTTLVRALVLRECRNIMDITTMYSSLHR
jgi:hypothetical protein